MAQSKDKDIWRESLVRYLGYANELGESFRPIVPRLVVPSYLFAFGYVLGDTVDKASKAHKKALAEGISTLKRNAVVVDATIDTLAWQTMASVVIPGFTINRVVRRRVGCGDELDCGATGGQELADSAALGPDGHWTGRDPADYPPDRQLRRRRHGQHTAQVVQSLLLLARLVAFARQDGRDRVHAAGVFQEERDHFGRGDTVLAVADDAHGGVRHAAVRDHADVRGPVTVEDAVQEDARAVVDVRVGLAVVGRPPRVRVAPDVAEVNARVLQRLGRDGAAQVTRADADGLAGPLHRALGESRRGAVSLPFRRAVLGLRDVVDALSVTQEEQKLHCDALRRSFIDVGVDVSPRDVVQQSEVLRPDGVAVCVGTEARQKLHGRVEGDRQEATGYARTLDYKGEDCWAGASSAAWCGHCDVHQVHWTEEPLHVTTLNWSERREEGSQTRLPGRTRRCRAIEFETCSKALAGIAVLSSELASEVGTGGRESRRRIILRVTNTNLHSANSLPVTHLQDCCAAGKYVVPSGMTTLESSGTAYAISMTYDGRRFLQGIHPTNLLTFVHQVITKLIGDDHCSRSLLWCSPPSVVRDQLSSHDVGKSRQV
ncbi:hypothetical protein ON010_g331 [Phytophthora cinnamomi]|nr:hypothetical protein ON010_g331 [Phytophthora cinnamomi]